MCYAVRITLRLFRTDTSKLAKFQRNGAGAVRIPATIARTGVMTRDGVREYRPPATVFADASLASLGSVPVTLGHPPEGVNPANAREYTIGHVSDAPPEARVKVDGSKDEWLRATMVVADGEALSLIEQDAAAEVSCGYFYRLDKTPGISPDGEPYDVLVDAIEYNHVAILTSNERARAGAQAKLRLDGKPMKIIVIDGVDYEQGSEKHIAKIQTDAAAAVKTATDRADALEAKLDAAKDSLAKVEAQLTADAVDARVEARFNLLQRAAKLLPANYDTKGKSDAQVRLDAVSAKIGADKVAGKSEVYVEARFDQLTEDSGAAEYHNPKTDGTAPTSRALNIDSDDDAFRASLAKKLGGEGTK